MAAPQLLVETYEVWTGTGPADPLKKKLHDGILTRPTAQNLVDSYVQMYASKLVDPANFNAAPNTAITDFLRMTNGPILNAQPLDAVFPTYPNAGTEPTWSSTQPLGF